MTILETNNDTFTQDVLDSDVPVIVDFWAPWCGPCKMVSPILEDMAKDFPDIKFTKVNIDQNSELAINFQIMSIPSIYKFEKGVPVAMVVGARSRASLEKELGLNS